MDNHRQEPSRENSRFQPVKVWDLPTRLFHWVLVALVAGSFITGNIGGNLMPYHKWFGYGILTLILFRVVWGFVGGSQSRFAAFLHGPGTVVSYAIQLIKGTSKPFLGHNPLGGWSIVAMLLVLLIQVGTGLFANDDILFEGPLYPLVSKDASDWLTGVHRVNRIVLAVLLSIHLFAVFYHLVFKKENLLKPMITGIKHWQGQADASTGNLRLAIIIAVLSAAVVFLIIS